MENFTKGKHMMFQTVLKVTSTVVTAISTMVKIADLVQKFKKEHQKSDRTAQS